MNHRGGVPMANLTDSGPPATPHRQLLPSLFRTFKAFYLLNYRAFYRRRRRDSDPHRFCQVITYKDFLTPSMSKLQALFLKLVEPNQYLMYSGGIGMLYCLIQNYPLPPLDSRGLSGLRNLMNFYRVLHQDRPAFMLRGFGCSAMVTSVGFEPNIFSVRG